MATFTYGLVSRKNAEYLMHAPAVLGGGIVTVPWELPVERPVPAEDGGGTWTDQVEGYMAALPFPREQALEYILVETAEAEYQRAVKHAQWLATEGGSHEHL